MNKASNLLLYYCTLVALFLSVSGFLTAKDSGALIFQAVFLPITLYFVIASVRNIKSGAFDISVSGRTTTLIIFLAIFAFLTGLAVKNILAKTGPKNEQVKSSQTQQRPDSSDKGAPLIFKKQEAK